jgi:undecaprenyl diphosphate synthase
MNTDSRLEHLISQLDKNNMPRHIAVIMDGNGRWAKKNSKPRFYGHNEGIKTVRRICEICGELKEIKVLTLYAFSSENWTRPSKEVKVLMHLLRSFLQNEIDEMNHNNIRLDTIGRTEKLPDIIKKQLEKAKLDTAQNTGFTLNLALNYSSKIEICDAVNRIIKKGYSECSPEIISDNLYTSEYPDPDLLIRTSGEIRLSNFMLWQLAYSEIWITETLWPDFTKEEFVQAILDFQKRERRYGGIK